MPGKKGEQLPAVLASMTQEFRKRTTILNDISVDPAGLFAPGVLLQGGGRVFHVPPHADVSGHCVIHKEGPIQLLPHLSICVHVCGTESQRDFQAYSILKLASLLAVGEINMCHL